MDYPPPRLASRGKGGPSPTTPMSYPRHFKTYTEEAPCLARTREPIGGDGRRVGLHRPASASTTTRSDHARDRLRPLLREVRLPHTTTGGARALARRQHRSPRGGARGQAGPGDRGVCRPRRRGRDDPPGGARLRAPPKVEPAPLVDRPELPRGPSTSCRPGWPTTSPTPRHRLQVPVDLCAQLAVGALAWAVAGGHATISAGHWRETPEPLPVVRHALRRRQEPGREGDDRPTALLGAGPTGGTGRRVHPRRRPLEGGTEEGGG